MWSAVNRAGLSYARRSSSRQLPLSWNVRFASNRGGRDAPSSSILSKNSSRNPEPKRPRKTVPDGYKMIVKLRPEDSGPVPRRSAASAVPPPPPESDPPRTRGPSGGRDSGGRAGKIAFGTLAVAGVVGAAYAAGLFDGDSGKSTGKDSAVKKEKTRPVKRYPADKTDFPAEVPYVLIGGGTASFAAFRAIKSKDPMAKVLLISAEDSLPYMRPPLSKEIWSNVNIDYDKLTFKQWNGQERSLFYEPPDFYTKIENLSEAKNGGITVATGWIASAVDASKKTVTLEDPETNSHFTIKYDKCLIATGSNPKNLPIFEKAPKSVAQKTILYKSIRDLEKLWATIKDAKTITIVGGGFLGSELACSLGRKNKQGTGPKITQIFKESGNMGKVLPEYLSKWTTDRVVEEGVEVIPNVEVLEAIPHGNQVSLVLSNGSSIKSDAIIVAVGSEPCTQLAETSSLEVDPINGGYLVNAELEARSNLYVAGDAACFYDPVLGRRRVEHHDHAVVSGRLAGENMAGASKAYKHQSMFWSDLGPEVGYEAIGIIDSNLPTVGVFAKDPPELGKPAVDSSKAADSEENASKEKEAPTSKITAKEQQDFSRGVIFYLRDNFVVGVVLWNVFNKMHLARQILAEKRKYEDLNEVAKLFNLYENHSDAQ